jgi:exopolysaccharide production protein ExoQ
MAHQIMSDDIDFRESSTSSLALIAGFFFAIRAFIIVLAVRLLGTDPQTGTAITLLSDGFLLVIAAFCCLGNRNRSVREMSRTASVRWCLAYLGFSCASLLWSETSSLPVAIAYWVGMAANFSAVVLMLRAQTAPAIVPSLMKGYVWGACVGASVAWLLPAQSDLRLGDEELLGPNNIAYPLAIGFLFAQFLIRTRLGNWAPPATFLAVTVLRSLSKTTILALLSAEILLLIADRSMSRRTKVVLVVSACLVLVSFSALLVAYWDVYLNAGNQSETLSGRLGIWAYFLVEGLQKPWFGHGFNSVWGIVPPFGPDKFEAAHAHNELIQQFYAYGAVGVAIFFGYYASLYLQTRKLPSIPMKLFLRACLVFFLVRGIADTERFDLSLPVWACLLLSELIEHERSAAKGQGQEFVATAPASSLQIEPG